MLTTVDGELYTREDIRRRVAQMANAIASLGAQPGDRISVQVEKSVGNLCLYL
ncbi:MAG: malonyl-CoA synthase, partial [Desulfuromonadales bacterium]|nr:malonyl-CoA synthase [Desulfuromonadales bacterium]